MVMTPSVRLIGLTLPVDDPDWEEAGEPSLGLKDGKDLMEFAGRWDYGENNAAKMWTNERWLPKRLAQGEESMLEMAHALFLITCTRVVSHELVRHRIASYQQESQRFTKYDEETPGNLFFVPPEIEELRTTNPELWRAYHTAMARDLGLYLDLRAAGVEPQIARYVFPNATRTRIIAGMNVRNWRHVLNLRLNKSAQPEMRVIARLIHEKLIRVYGGVLFPADIAERRGAR